MKTLLIVLLSILSLGQIAAQSNPVLSDQYFKKSMEYFDKEDFVTAKIYCDSAIIANTENVEAYAYRGVCQFQQGKFELAIQDFDLALILSSGYAEVYYYRGICKMEMGNKTAACEDWMEAYDLGYKKVLINIQQYCELEKEKP